MIQLSCIEDTACSHTESHTEKKNQHQKNPKPKPPQNLVQYETA